MIEATALILCKLGGKSGSADEIKSVLAAAGLEANDDLIGALTGDMEGKDINELLAAGGEKMKDVPFGGGGGGGGGRFSLRSTTTTGQDGKRFSRLTAFSPLGRFGYTHERFS